MDVSIRKKQLQYYLGMFWVQPTKSVELRSVAEKSVSSNNPVFGFKFSSQLELKQFAQAVILSFHRKVDWQAVNTYEIVERFLQADPITMALSEPEVLFIYHGFNELPNRQLHNMTNGVISSREAQGKKTYLLSIKEDNEFCITLYPVSSGTTSSSSSEVI